MFDVYGEPGRAYFAMKAFGQFLKAHPDQRPNLTDVLIGRLSKDFDPFFAEVGRYSEVPDPLPHGLPLERSPAR